MEGEKLNKVYVYTIALVAAIGGFLFGYDLSIISGAIIFLKKAFTLDAFGEGFAVSSVIIGCMLGSLAGAWMADEFGRKKTLYVAAVLFAISAVGTAVPQQISDFLANILPQRTSEIKALPVVLGGFGCFNLFRMVGGLGVGLASVVSPMYIAEISPPKIRGQLVSLNQMAIVTGSFIAIVVTWLLSKTDFSNENWAWQWMFGSECAPILFFLFALLLVPESPRWLAETGKREKAIEVLTKINGREHAESEMKEIEALLSRESGGFKELFMPGLRLALLIAIALAFFQQMSGVSTLMFYAPRIFQQSGIEKTSDAIAQTIVLNIWNIFCTALAIWLVDKIGRRPLLLIGTLGMALGTALMGVLFLLNLSGILLLLVFFLCIGAYVTSLAPLTWLIMSEIFPTRIRSKAMSIGAITLWICCYLANQIFPPMRETFEKSFGTNAGAFWVFSGICLAAFIFALIIIPETKGRTLEDIASSWLRESKTK